MEVSSTIGLDERYDKSESNCDEIDMTELNLGRSTENGRKESDGIASMIKQSIRAEESSLVNGCSLQVDDAIRSNPHQLQKLQRSLASESDNSTCSTGTSCNLKTLEDALMYFDLSLRVEDFQKSIEDVRRHKKSEEDHESCFRELDKEMLRLCRIHHPDRVENEQGSAEEVEKAQKLQAALNSTRAVLSFLNRKFLEDLDVDHNYEFYLKLSIGTLGNEDDVENYVYEVLFKLSYVSEIKQKVIIAEIRKFLEESRKCVSSYLKSYEREFEKNYTLPVSSCRESYAREYVNHYNLAERNCRESCVREFEKHFNLAGRHLKKCIEGYEKLVKEYEAVERECEEESNQSMKSIIGKMKSESSLQLKSLKKLTEGLSSGRMRKLSNWPNADNYFVLPFCNYFDLMLLCKFMINADGESCSALSFAQKLFSFFWLNSSPYDMSKDPSTSHSELEIPDHSSSESVGNNLRNIFVKAFHLASYYNGDKRYKSEVMDIMNWRYKNKGEIKQKFNFYVRNISEILMKKFKIEEYHERCLNKHVTQELNNCMRMMKDFDKKAEELLRQVREFNKDYEEMKEKCYDIMKKNKDSDEKIEQQWKEIQILKESIDTPV